MPGRLTARTHLRTARVLGALYVVAGVGKFFPQIESVQQRLEDARAANVGTIVHRPTAWLADNHQVATVIVAAAMISAGMVLIVAGGPLMAPALRGTLLMIATFIAILVRSQPIILVVDLPFILAAVYLLRSLRAARAIPAV